MFQTAFLWAWPKQIIRQYLNWIWVQSLKIKVAERLVAFVVEMGDEGIEQHALAEFVAIAVNEQGALHRFVADHNYHAAAVFQLRF